MFIEDSKEGDSKSDIHRGLKRKFENSAHFNSTTSQKKKHKFKNENQIIHLEDELNKFCDKDKKFEESDLSNWNLPASDELFVENYSHKKKKKKKHKEEPDDDQKAFLKDFCNGQVCENVNNGEIEYSNFKKIKRKKHENQNYEVTLTTHEIDPPDLLTISEECNEYTEAKTKRKKKHKSKREELINEDTEEISNNTDVRKQCDETDISDVRISKKKHKNRRKELNEDIEDLNDLVSDKHCHDGDESDVKILKKKRNHKEMHNEDSGEINVSIAEKQNHDIDITDVKRLKKKKKHKDKRKELRDEITEEINDTDIQQQDYETIVETLKKKKKNKDKRKKLLDENTEELNDTNTEQHDYETVENNIETLKKKKKHKDKRKELRDENTEELNVTDMQQDYEINDTLKKKQKHKDKTKELIDENTEKLNDTDIQEQDYETIENNIETLKKKKKHKDKRKELIDENTGELNNTNTQEQDYGTVVNNVEISKKKKKLKEKRNEDSFIMSTGNSMNHDLNMVDLTSIKKFENNDIEKDSSTEDVTHSRREFMKESTPVAKSESVCSEDTFTIEVHEDKDGSLNNSSCSRDSQEENKSTNGLNETSNKEKNLKERDLNKSHHTENSVTVKEETRISDDDIKDIDDMLTEEDKSNVLTGCQNKTLESLYITIPWAVPPLHMVETRIADRPSPEQRKVINNLGVEIKAGPFSMKEDKVIERNWKEFCKLHDIPEDDVLLFTNFKRLKRFPLKERINFGRFLAHDLNNRLLFSVYKRFKRLYCNKKIKIGRFTEQEDEIILKYVENCSNNRPFAHLAKILKRDNLAIMKRYTLLCSGVERQSWLEKENTERFLKYIRKVTKCSDIEELEERTITSEEWKKLSKKLKAPSEKLRRAWLSTLYPRLFLKDTVSTATIKKKLFDVLVERKEHDWRTVNWDHIAKNFEGFTGIRLNQMFKCIVNYHVPIEIRHDLKKCLEFLQTKEFTGKVVNKLKLNEEGSPQ